MNRIYWDIDKISMLTDHLDAAAHRHGMMQFFLCLDGRLEIKVAGEKQICSCIMVNKNIKHSFKTNHKVHFTCVFEPVSDIGIKLNQLLDGKEYYIFDEVCVSEMRSMAAAMVDVFDKGTYKAFMKAVYKAFDVDYKAVQMDDRILELLNLLEHCGCEEHALEHYANELCLSASRLSHLFSEQAGISLKSYLTLHQLERAFQDMLDGKKITEASINAGFYSPSHFASTVKRMMGLPARSTVKDSEFLKVY